MGLASLLMLLVILVWLYKTAPAMVVTSTLLFFQFGWILASVWYIELNPGMLLVSTYSYTEDSGARTAIGFQYIAFLLGMLCIAAIFPERARFMALNESQTCVPTSARSWSILTFAAMLTLTVNAFASENIMTSPDVERAAFYMAPAIPIAPALNMALPATLAVAGFCFARYGRVSKALSWRALATFGLALTTAVLSGTQFSGYVLIVVSFALPMALTSSHDIARRRVNQAWLLLAFGFIGSAVYKAFSLANSSSYTGVVSGGWARFFYRAFALQGEVYWRTFQSFGDLRNPEQFDREALVLAKQLPDQESGIYVLMEQLVPNYDGSSLYTLNAGFPAILIYVFGFSASAIIACFVCGLAFGLAARLFVREVRHESPTGTFASYGILYSLYLSFTMGGALYISSVSMLGSLALMLILVGHRSLGRRRPTTPNNVRVLPVMKVSSSSAANAESFVANSN